MFLVGKVPLVMINSLMRLRFRCVLSMAFFTDEEPSTALMLLLHFLSVLLSEVAQFTARQKDASIVKQSCIIQGIFQNLPGRQLQVKLFLSCFCATSVQVALFWQGWLWQASNSSHREPLYASSHSQKNVA